MFNLQREDADDLWLPLYKPMIDRMKELWGYSTDFCARTGCRSWVFVADTSHAAWVLWDGATEGSGNQHIKTHTVVFPPPFLSWGHFPALFQSRGTYQNYRITHWNQEIWCMPCPSKGGAGNRSGIRPTKGRRFTITMLSPSVQL